MRQISAARLARMFKWTANATVLVLLIALAYWGHQHHWEIPTYSGLVDKEPSLDTQVTVPDKNPPTEFGREPAESSAVARVQSGGRTEGLDLLPVVGFDSETAVLTAGIESASVERRPLEEYVTCHGVVDYDHTKLARLSARVAGTVWRVEKTEGEPVRKGDILALIDSAKVGQAKAEFLEATVQSKLKQETLNRLRGLGDVIAGKRLLEAEADWRAARIRRINSEQALITLGLPITADDSTPEFIDQLVSSVQFLGLPEATVATIHEHTRSANLLPLVSPLDGVVIRRDVVTGEVVDTSETLFAVADVNDMWLDLFVRAEDASSLAIGQDVLVPVDPLFGELEGTVIWISTEVDSTTRTTKLRARIPNPRIASGNHGSRLLRAQTYVTARVRVRTRESALMIPNLALRWFWKESCHVVFLPAGDGTQFVPRRVETGITRNGYTEIRSGLSDGDRVISTGSRLLHQEMLAAIARLPEVSSSPVPNLATGDGLPAREESDPSRGL